MREVFKPIPGYEGLYEASNFGRIKSCARLIPMPGKNQNPRYREAVILKPGVSNTGYEIVVLRKDNKSKSCSVHRLVSITFIKNNAKKRCVNHKDGNKKNNNVDNLEWSTHSENNQHAYDKGLKKANPNLGEKHHSSTLNELQVHAIRKMLREQKRALYIAKRFGVTDSAIYAIKYGNTWRHLQCKLTS